jgi:hypothetical protein
VGILSNGLAAGRAPVRDALLRLDGRMMKLDPGPPEDVNGVRFDAERVAESYAALKPYTLQAMVARGAGWDASSDAALAAWLPLLTRAAPNRIQLYSLDRPPADPRVGNVPRERLTEMARAIQEALPRCVVEVF